MQIASKFTSLMNICKTIVCNLQDRIIFLKKNSSESLQKIYFDLTEISCS